MNYFELFDIPVSFTPDMQRVKERFYALSRQYHPDFYVQADGNIQTDVLEKTALINKAFKTFNSADETIKYVLTIKGMLEEEEKYQLPPDFLMEMMELNEQLSEGVDKAHLSALNSQLYEAVKDIMEYYQEGITTPEELLQVKEYYFKRKYIQRIVERMN